MYLPLALWLELAAEPAGRPTKDRQHLKQKQIFFDKNKCLVAKLVREGFVLKQLKTIRVFFHHNCVYMSQK